MHTGEPVLPPGKFAGKVQGLLHQGILRGGKHTHTFWSVPSKWIPAGYFISSRFVQQVGG